jgi:hypothetical protein
MVVGPRRERGGSGCSGLGPGSSPFRRSSRPDGPRWVPSLTRSRRRHYPTALPRGRKPAARCVRSPIVKEPRVTAIVSASRTPERNGSLRRSRSTMPHRPAGPGRARKRNGNRTPQLKSRPGNCIPRDDWGPGGFAGGGTQHTLLHRRWERDSIQRQHAGLPLQVASAMADEPRQKLGLVKYGVSCSSCVQQDLSWVCR